MNSVRLSLAACLPVVGLLGGVPTLLLTACDTFAPPPTRQTNQAPSPAGTTPTLVTTSIPPQPTGTVPMSTSGINPTPVPTCSRIWVVFDGDGDRYGDGAAVCGVVGANWSQWGGDCADADPAINPEATEVPWDGVDSNCDSYDVPLFAADEPGDVITWTNGALCEGGVLAVVALDRGTLPPGGVYLQIANVGTEPVAEATLILNRSAPDSDQPTTSTAVPPLAPGEVVRTELILYGQYDVHFTYPLFAPATPVSEAGSDAGAEGGIEPPIDTTRCALAQQAFAFSSQLLEPL